MEQEQKTPYSKRERRNAVHIAQFTPSGLKRLTEVAEASGVSRNEAVVQACETWVAEREAKPANKVKVSIPVDVRQLKRLSKVARKNNTTVEAFVVELLLAKIEEESKRKSRAKGGGSEGK